jgi:alpha-L-rhamnosidase
VGTNLLLPTLARHGLTDMCYTLLMQTDCPSWLFPVTQGATTIWERWDGWHPDRGFQNPGMNSFNHYAYGAVGEWLYRHMLGLEIDPDAPAYKHAIIQPTPDLTQRRITSAAGGVDTPFGRLDAAWRVEDETFTLDVTIPFNTTATAKLPAAALETARESEKPLAEAEGVANAHHADGQAVFNLDPGVYRFATTVPQPNA